MSKNHEKSQIWKTQFSSKTLADIEKLKIQEGSDIQFTAVVSSIQLAA